MIASSKMEAAAGSYKAARSHKFMQLRAAEVKALSYGSAPVQVITVKHWKLRPK
jgi:hypothetical protein